MGRKPLINPRAKHDHPTRQEQPQRDRQSQQQGHKIQHRGQFQHGDERHLQEGVAASTRQDAQAKAVGEWLRARVVSVPSSVIR